MYRFHISPLSCVNITYSAIILYKYAPQQREYTQLTVFLEWPQGIGERRMRSDVFLWEMQH